MPYIYSKYQLPLNVTFDSLRKCYQRLKKKINLQTVTGSSEILCKINTYVYFQAKTMMIKEFSND